MAEPLNLEAGVVDKFSKPLKDLRDRLKDVKPPTGLRDTHKQFADLKKQVDEAARAIKDGLGGAMGGLGVAGMGIGALGAAGAIASLTAAVRKFGDSTVALDNFNKSTGVSIKLLQQLKTVAPAFGVSSEAIQGDLQSWASKRDEFVGYGGAYQNLLKRPGGKALAERLRRAALDPNKDAFTEENLRIQSELNGQERRRFQEDTGQNGDLGSLTTRGLSQLNKMRQGANAYVPSDEDTRRAQAFEEAVSKVSASFEKMTISVGGTLAPQITAVAEALAKFTDAHLNDIKGFFEDFAKTLSSEDWKGDAAAAAAYFKAIKEFTDKLVGADDTKPGGAANPRASRSEARDGEYYRTPGGFSFQRSGVGDTIGGWIGAHIKDAPTKPGFVQPQHPHTETPTPGTKPDNRGVRDTFMGDGDPIAYRPGQRFPLNPGTIGARDAIQTIAAGVTKGMQDFATSLNGGGGDVGGAGGGLVNASFNPNEGGGRVRSVFGGGGRGGSVGISAPVDAGGVPFIDNGGKGEKNAFLDYISRGESGKAGYDAVLGNGKYGAPDKPVSTMTLNEVLAFGDQIRHNPNNPYNSSALGRYQIVGKTLRGLMKQLGLKGDEIYSPEMQDRLAWALAKARGRNVAGLRQEWQSLTGRSGSQILNAYDQGMREHQEHAAGKNRPSLARNSGAIKTPDAKAPTGKVDIHVHSKDQPVTIKDDGSDLFREFKVNRGRSMPLINT
ncbi:hypothetical protein LMIY3S_03697 [Labrys miyagiensis]